MIKNSDELLDSWRCQPVLPGGSLTVGAVSQYDLEGSLTVGAVNQYDLEGSLTDGAVNQYDLEGSLTVGAVNSTTRRGH